MTENTAQDVDGDEDLMRQRLLRRIAMAGVLIVALVASLAIFDTVFVDAPAPESAGTEPAATASISVPSLEERGLEAGDNAADKTAEKTADKSAEPLVETQPPVPDEKPASVQDAAPPSAPAKTTARDKQEVKPIARPESKAAVKSGPPVPEGTAAPSVPLPPQPLQPSQPPAPKAQAAKPAPVSPSEAPLKPLAPGQGYHVQMGVFSNIGNAEELKRKLDNAGIPSHIEARVQVGPFRSKAEAEAAQKKLAEMGLSGLLLSPRK